jgi:mono/diheme cytochrome c family protein
VVSTGRFRRSRKQSPRDLTIGAAESAPQPTLRHAFAAFLTLSALVAAGCDAGTGGVVESGSISNGKRLFQEKCASCHTLGDAGSTAVVGPNLDDAFAGARQQGFDESTIENVVADQIKYASGQMPPNLVTGSDTDDVAAYVASVAGTKGFSEGGGGGTTTGGGESDGEAIFTAQGCGSCHVLAAAGSNGTVGPNLDESRPSVELAVERVTNGKGPMPSFKDRLSPEQIRAVAEFVARSAGR